MGLTPLCMPQELHRDSVVMPGPPRILSQRRVSWLISRDAYRVPGLGTAKDTEVRNPSVANVSTFLTWEDHLRSWV